MNDNITAGAMVLTIAMAASTGIARAWPTPSDRHPAPAPAPAVRAVLDEASLDELLGPWPEPEYPTPGTPIQQGWRHCHPCDQNTVSVLHPEGWTCGECLKSTAADTATSTGDPI